ncbi:hypothetical protein BH09VER1_BH09VER1_47720 [soil metagenome]
MKSLLKICGTQRKRSPRGSPGISLDRSVIEEVEDTVMEDDARFAGSEVVAAIGAVPGFENDALILGVEAYVGARTAILVF